MAHMKAKTLQNHVEMMNLSSVKHIYFSILMNTERSDLGKTKVLSPTESNVKIEQIIYFKYKNMLHNISE